MTGNILAFFLLLYYLRKELKENGDVMKKIMAVEKQDIIKIANEFTLDTVFVFYVLIDGIFGA